MIKTWPRLTELQLAVLAAIRDREVQGFFDYRRSRFVYGGRATLIGWKAHGFEVTGQIRSLRNRRLISMSGRDARGIQVYTTTQAGDTELAKYPEF